ncbi:MAG: efflux RND transporter periplasmic adaptor subunit [Candidatus Latescibacteria bacterium]|nr:efflux RND transporter periplasmic adaptor subunit [Candidatus Latescibacterota bacterium]
MSVRKWSNYQLLLLLMAMTFGGCAEKEEEPLWGSGVLEAEEVVVAPTIGGRLLLRTVEEGDSVEEGTLIAIIDTTSLVEVRDLAAVGLRGIAVQRRQAQNALDATRERLEQAVRNRDRLQALVESEAASQSQLDELETAVVLAGKQVEAAETAFETFPVQEREIRLRIASLQRQIGDCRLIAPRAGTVLTVYAEPGEVVAPGRGVVRIADLSELFVRVYIPAPLVGRVRLGGGALVRVDSSPDRTFPGRVVHISEEAEFTPKNVQTPEARADLVFAVKVAVSNREGLLKIGLPADVDLPEIMP